MNYYTLKAIVNGELKDFSKKKFSTRQGAIDFMFDYLDREYIYDKEVSDVYPVGNDKHRIEYVCDYYTRFIVSRETF